MDGTGAPSALTIGVPREQIPGERRVALVPEVVTDLVKAGFGVVVQSGAGMGAFLDDDAYREAGAEIAPTATDLLARVQIIAKVQPPLLDEVALFRPGQLLISFLDRTRDTRTVEVLAERGVVAFSFNAVPRITRAQSMDALSVMSTVGGYKAVLMAADTIGRFFPLLMTAAGTVPPARVFVIGAGVAGLQALATARRLGAVTTACDARPVVREQVQSVGAKFVDMSVPEAEGEGGYARVVGEELLRLERAAIRDHVANSDVIISTALVPGAPAPLLITTDMVEDMNPGSVIVDLAAEGGGNCELTRLGETVVHQGVTIIGPANLPSSLPRHASQMYARNINAVLKHLVKDGTLVLDPEDEITRSACLTPLAAVAG